jgi:hypothetical protein
MARYGYGISVSGSRTSIVSSSEPAPSGIPVASTNTIIVVDTAISINFSGTYQKDSSTSYTNESDPMVVLFYSGGQWGFANFDASQYRYATPPSTDINYIATTGWPTQTLTAA